MLNATITKQAHKMAKQIKSQFADVNYSVQFGLCVSFLLNNKEDSSMITIEQIQEMATEEGMEATLWVQKTMVRVYFNYYTGSGTRKSKGMFIISKDGKIDVDKKGIYTMEVKRIWNAIDDTQKFDMAPVIEKQKLEGGAK